MFMLIVTTVYFPNVGHYRSNVKAVGHVAVSHFAIDHTKALCAVIHGTGRFNLRSAGLYQLLRSTNHGDPPRVFCQRSCCVEQPAS